MNHKSIVFALCLWTLLCTQRVWPSYVIFIEHKLSHFKSITSQGQFRRKVTLLFLTRRTNPLPLSTYYTTITKSTCLCQPFLTHISIMAEIVARASYVASLLIKVASAECVKLEIVFWSFKKFHISVFPVRRSGDLNRRQTWLYTLTYTSLIGSLWTCDTSYWLKVDSHISCRSRAAPMSLPCHAVPLRV